MTWEEFKEKAEKIGYNEEPIIVNSIVWLTKKGLSKKGLSFDLCFNNDGMVLLSGDEEYILAEEKTPDQMWQIMEALR